MTRLIHWVGRRPLAPVGAAAVLFVLAGLFGVGVVERFSTADPFRVAASESAHGERLTRDLTGRDPIPVTVLLVKTPAGATSPAGLRRVRAVSRAARATPGVEAVVDLRDVPTTGSAAPTAPTFVSRDGNASYALVYGKPGADRRVLAERMVARFAGRADVVTVGGPAVAERSIEHQVDADLARAELLAFPLLLLAAVIVFRGLVAAALPVMVGLLTLALTLLGLRLVNELLPMSVFALNLSLALGLGLAIDYSLFVVSRFREELARGHRAQQAMGKTLDSTGRTVVYSAVTVSAALAALLVFPQMFLYSMAISGAITALLAAAISVTVLPAVLLLLGPRVNALAPARWQRASAAGEPSPAWGRLARSVMRRALPVAVATGALLVVCGIPFARAEFTGIDARVLPAGDPARVVDEQLQRQFARPANASIAVVVEEAAAGATGGAGVQRYARSLGELPGASGVTTPVLIDGARTWSFELLPKRPALDRATLDLVQRARAVAAPGAALLSGPSAYLVDQRDAIAERLPLFALVLALSTSIALFLMTGSVVLPLKTLLMNVLSLSATFGLLVFVFQDGRFEGLLGYESRGALESTQPLLLLALTFGLSTDYAVFLLMRIKEARDAGLGDDEAVAAGVQRTGKIITAAAALFAIAMGAFTTSKIGFIKEVGIGTAVAVLIDATIIRALLVPALMKLLGARNWWAPVPLRRLHMRIAPHEARSPVSPPRERRSATPPPPTAWSTHAS